MLRAGKQSQGPRKPARVVAQLARVRRCRARVCVSSSLLRSSAALRVSYILLPVTERFSPHKNKKELKKSCRRHDRSVGMLGLRSFRRHSTAASRLRQAQQALQYDFKAAEAKWQRRWTAEESERGNSNAALVARSS